MVYVNCPICGQRLMEAGTGSAVRIKCRKCNRFIGVAVKGDGVVLRVREKQCEA